MRSLNVDYEGDTPCGDFPVLIPRKIYRQRQTLVSKSWLKKQQRQKFNNMSLKRKNAFRKVERMTGKVLIR